MAAVAVVIAAVALTRGGSGSSSAGTGTAATGTVQEQIVTAMADVSTAQSHVESQLSSLELSDSSFKRAQDAGTELHRSVEKARSSLGAVPSTSGDDAAMLAAAEALLTAESDLADAMANLPRDPIDFNSTDAEKLESRSKAVNGAAGSLSQAVAAAPQMAEVTSGDISKVKVVAERAAEQRDLKVFVVKMENMLSQSTQGRAEVSSTISGVMNHCQIPPDEASHRLNDVANNRQSLLDQASAMDVPNDNQASRTLDLFQQMLQHSIAADRDFSKWMDHLFVYYYTFPVGCPGRVPTNREYDAAVAQSHQADADKTQFVRLFNPLATGFGLKSNWRASQI